MGLASEVDGRSEMILSCGYLGNSLVKVGGEVGKNAERDSVGEGKRFVGQVMYLARARKRRIGQREGRRQKGKVCNSHGGNHKYAGQQYRNVQKALWQHLMSDKAPILEKRHVSNIADEIFRG